VPNLIPFDIVTRNAILLTNMKLTERVTLPWYCKILGGTPVIPMLLDSGEDEGVVQPLRPVRFSLYIFSVIRIS
jgi:hypothetical protein